MGSNPAFAGDAWSFWLGPIQADGVPLTSSTVGLTVSASVLLDNAPWGGPYVPVYNTGLSRWSLALELPGPGSVVVRWLVVYAHPTLGNVMKTSEQSLFVESRKPPVTVVGQTNLAWDIGPAGPAGPVGPQGPPGAAAVLTVTAGTPFPATTLTFQSGAFILTETAPNFGLLAPNFGTIAGSIAEGSHLHDTRYYTEAEVDALIAAGGNVRVVYAQQTVEAGDTVANTVAATIFTSKYTIPSAAFVAGRVYRVTAYGVWRNNNVNPTITLDFMLGSVVIGTVSVAGTGGTTQVFGWSADGTVSILTTGAAGTVEAHGRWFVTDNTTGNSESAHTINSGTTVIDTTADRDLALRMTWSAAHANNTITLRRLMVERIGPV